ncbi:MAG: radical SAM family heme chaperone HemW [Leptospirales bacterium]|nr:radical SAM family heme chaperone HemW [Leptospirales bacterium]
MNSDLPALLTPPRRADLLGVYIHFPYCIRKCRYCDFYSTGLNVEGGNDQLQPSAEQLREYEEALMRELGDRRDDFAGFQSVNTIFFGGGTASLAPAALIDRILRRISEEFTLTTDCEVTLEGNPEDFSADYLHSLQQCGVNRIHVGVQTLETRHLQAMDRYFSASSYQRIFERLSEAPQSRIGVDLIYGFPQQTLDEFLKDLTAALGARLDHLSLYSLTVEAGTPYAALSARRQMGAPDEELQFQVFQMLPGLLAARGFQHYEISNYALAGGASRHNLRYWLYEPYLALGPGAHGFTGRLRYANPRSIQQWQMNPAQRCFQEAAPLEEAALGALRLCGGIPLSLFERDLVREYHLPEELKLNVRSVFQQWQDRGYGRLDADYFTWNMEGMLRLDDRIAEFCSRLGPAAGS